LLQAEEEFSLIKKISNYPDIVTRSADDLAPHLIAKFCFDLSQLVNNYYAHVKILTDDEPMKKARVTLLIKTVETLKQAMQLIGMVFLERM
jgi:arginyl-tRNA synthetase